VLLLAVWLVVAW